MTFEVVRSPCKRISSFISYYTKRVKFDCDYFFAVKGICLLRLSIKIEYVTYCFLFPLERILKFRKSPLRTRLKSQRGVG